MKRILSRALRHLKGQRFTPPAPHTTALLNQEGGDNNQRPSSGGERPPGGGGAPNMRPSRGLFGVASILLIIVMLFLVVTSMSQQAQKVSWKDFSTFVANGYIEPGSIVIRDTSITAKRKAGPDFPRETDIQFPLTGGERDFYRQELLKLTGGDFQERSSPIWTQVLLSVVPFIVIIVILWMVIARGLRNAAGGAGGVLGNFGKSRHRVLAKEMTGVTFNDVAGIDEAKDEVTEIIEFLKNPKRFMRLGGRIPRGVLLIGEPGCGKTLLAKAIAGEADVPFFSISGSDFVEMFVGVGASRVRDLFKQAKESAPCIIFLDEIDAVGRRRGGGFTTGGHDEREQTLNAILVEMDGFNSSDGVIVIAATNRSDVLDPALTRPGRFDRQIVVPRPDLQGRIEILKVHAKKVKMGPDVDLERIARATPMFSGADLAALINEAAIAATLHNKDFVEHEDLEEARDKVKWGRSRKSRAIEEKERIATAYHEAGHAVLQMLIPDADPLHKVTIIPRGLALGATFSFPEKDRYGFSLRWLKATMRVVCGGRIAEEKKTDDVSSGAAMDIQQLTTLARAMVLEWGMSQRLGFVRYSGTDTRESFLPEREYSEETAKLIDEEIRAFASQAFEEAKRLLLDNWEKVEAVAQALLRFETLSRAEVERLMRGESLGKSTVSDLLAAEARRAEEQARRPKPAPREPDLPPGAMPRPA